MNIKFETLIMEDFASNLHGHNPERKLEVGDIPYYTGLPSGVIQNKKEHHYFIASVVAPSKYNKKKKADRIVGMLELEESPYENDVIWLQYISVDEKFRDQGIAKKLNLMMCEFLKDKDFRLERSTPSEDVLKYIKSVIDGLVQEHKIVTIKKPTY
jgi:ribosomal protein S18 acetylase RimI-like enzyme